MNITIPDLCLVVLVGASGSGKSTFARRHFLPTEVISSDFCRGLVSDDENNQAATNDAFELLHIIAAKRLALGKLVAIDATNVQPEARKPLVGLARQHHVQAVAIVLDTPEAICQQRNSLRPDRSFGPHVVRNQIRSDTERGGEGMVVKPSEFIIRGRHGMVQPGVKCRGREYLRIIYGPEYTAPENLTRLRSRGLGRKRSLALREFSLGAESLERFVRCEPLRRVHECVFGVLAMESEPVDPRL